MTDSQELHFKLVSSENTALIRLIAEWYAAEWNIPTEISSDKLRQLPAGNHQFQVVMYLGDKPIATGAVYNHVGIQDKMPRLNAYQHWLALVYTFPEFRQRGYGALLCEYIQEHARVLGLKELYLFTHTAESLYRRLLWEQVERIEANGKDIVVMRKTL